MAVEHLRDALAARYGALAAPDGRNAAPVPAPSTGRGAVSAGEFTHITPHSRCLVVFA
jgi:hypothetical protein